MSDDWHYSHKSASGHDVDNFGRDQNGVYRGMDRYNNNQSQNASSSGSRTRRGGAAAGGGLGLIFLFIVVWSFVTDFIASHWRLIVTILICLVFGIAFLIVRKKSIKPKLTVLGILVCFLVLRFVRIPIPFFSSWFLALSIISIMAVIFGGIAGGIIGFFGITLNDLTFLILNSGFHPLRIAIMIAAGVSFGLFGLLTGIICQRFVLGKKENSMLINVVFVFLITLVLAILTGLIEDFLLAIIFRENFFEMNLINNILFLLKGGGLVTGILCSLAAFIYLKWRVKKGTSPVEETKQPEQNTTQDT